jgi:hypothetical protein
MLIWYFYFHDLDICVEVTLCLGLHNFKESGDKSLIITDVKEGDPVLISGTIPEFACR